MFNIANNVGQTFHSVACLKQKGAKCEMWGATFTETVKYRRCWKMAQMRKNPCHMLVHRSIEIGILSTMKKPPPTHHWAPLWQYSKRRFVDWELNRSITDASQENFITTQKNASGFPRLQLC